MAPDIVGAEAFASGRAATVSGLRVAGSRLRIQLTHPSSTFLARISTPLFCVVPPGTPFDAGGVPQVPTAAPYYIAASDPPDSLVLRRNPNYSGPRPQRLREIRISFGLGKQRTVEDVEAGRFDYSPGMNTAPGALRLARQYGPGSPAARAGGERFVATPWHALNVLTFNTARGPFSSTRLRKAVNYALDRRGRGRAHAGGLGHIPTSQYLPSTGVPGFRPARIYPLSPDLARARHLAGSRQRSVVLYNYTLPELPTVAPFLLEVAHIIKANLERIGFDVQIRTFPFPIFLQRLSKEGEPWDIALGALTADYPDPYDFLHRLDSRAGAANLGAFHDPTFDERLDAVAKLPPGQRERTLSRLADDVARAKAPWAALFTQVEHGFFSARTGCRSFQPVYGLDLPLVCLKGG